MANIKSQKKRNLTNEKDAARNRAVKSSVKTAVKKVRTAVESGDKEAASAALVGATSAIDKAKAKGIIKKNTAARKVSRLSQSVNKIGQA